jgi:hypothetical protein
MISGQAEFHVCVPHFYKTLSFIYVKNTFNWTSEELLLKQEDEELVLTIVLVENLHVH